jgi:serine/threonine-protein kinase
MEAAMVGRLLGHYTIESQLGAGGMGVVYKATDTKLSRAVAIKVIRDEFIEEGEHLARFAREARMLASLNHPHVAAIQGLEECDGTRFLVLEYVPGETLAERLKRGHLPIREALLIGKQIAEALEAAHEKGIIHRDLKPANVMLSEASGVKVLDFGLAKPLTRQQSPGETGSTATMSAAVTQKTVSIGTAAYMSPEQARGKEIDARADIWAFGCLVYEALTGRQAFRGETVTEVLASILEREPDWAELPSATPAPVLALLKRCLRKDPQRRLRDIGDARIEIEDWLAAPAQEDPARKQTAVTRRTAISGLSGATVGAAAMGVFAISRYRGAVPRHLTRFSIAMPEGEFHRASFNRRVAISPDGTRIAFNTAGSGVDGNFYMRSLNELESKRVKDVNGAGAFFSPDSRWVGFILVKANVAAGIRKLALSGGAPVTVCATDNFLGATWADGDTIYFVPELPGGVVAVPAAGGQPKEIVKIDFVKGERQHRYPCALPGGRAVMFTTSTADIATFDEAHIGVFSLETGRKKILVEGGTHPRYSPSGHLLYAHDAKIFAIRFDAKGSPQNNIYFCAAGPRGDMV